MAWKKVLSEKNHGATGDPHAQYALDSDLSTHVGAADPHTGYQKESEKGAVSGYCGLDSSALVVHTDLPTGTGATEVALGNHTHDTYLAKTGLTTWDEQGSNPAAPISDKWKLFFKPGGLYYISDADVVTGPLSAGGSSTASTSYYQVLLKTGYDPQTDDGAWEDNYGVGERLAGNLSANGEFNTDKIKTMQFEVTVPEDYDASSQSLSVMVRAKIQTSAKNICTLDLEASTHADSTANTDICATAAQNLTTAWANYTFTITDTGLTDNDRLLLFFSVSLPDAPDGGNSPQVLINRIDIKVA